MLKLTFLFLITFCYSQICGPINPQSLVDCSPFSTAEKNENNECCFAKLISKNKTSSNSNIQSANVCVTIPKNQTFIAPYITRMDLGLSNFYVDIKIDCGNQTFPRGFEKCGPENPQSFDDCDMYSLPISSCCYFASPDGTSTCIMNPGILNKNTTQFGFIIACNSNFLNNYFYFILVIISMILII
jgi:hypothetical protein